MTNTEDSLPFDLPPPPQRLRACVTILDGSIPEGESMLSTGRLTRRRVHLLSLAAVLVTTAVGAPAHAGPREDDRTERRDKRGERRAMDTARKPLEPASCTDRGAAIDLLDQLDVKGGTKLGQWTLGNAGLRCEGEGPGKLVLGNAPEGEYDFRIEFTRDSGDGNVAMLLSCKDTTLGWLMGETRGDGARFTEFQRGGNRQNMGSLALEVARRYEVVVCVRRDAVTGIVDGEPMEVAALDGFAKTLHGDMQIDPGKLAVMAWSPVVFHTVEVVPVPTKKPRPAAAVGAGKAGVGNSEPDGEGAGDGNQPKQNRPVRKGRKAPPAAAGELLPLGSKWRGVLTNKTRQPSEVPCTATVKERDGSRVVLVVKLSTGGLMDWTFDCHNGQLQLAPGGIQHILRSNQVLTNQQASGRVDETKLGVDWSFDLFGPVRKGQREWGKLLLQRDDTSE